MLLIFEYVIWDYCYIFRFMIVKNNAPLHKKNIMCPLLVSHLLADLKQWHFQGKDDIFDAKVIFFWSSYFFREKSSGRRRPHHRHTSPIIWTVPAAPNENSLAIGGCRTPHLTVSPFSSSSSIWHNVICSISKSGKFCENYIL